MSENDRILRGYCYCVHRNLHKNEEIENLVYEIAGQPNPFKDICVLYDSLEAEMNAERDAEWVKCSIINQISADVLADPDCAGCGGTGSH